MSIRTPVADGELNIYNLGGTTAATPRIYYVNGIQSNPRDHAVVAAYLSLLIERPVVGVYNATAGKGSMLSTGFWSDISQCLKDFTQNTFARPFSSAHKQPSVPESKINEFLLNVEKKYYVWNRATLELFKQLVRHRHEKQLIVAHSQGNLITSNALFVLEDVLGSAGLSKIRVYSLASPAPAWPVSLSVVNGGGGRQDNAFMNDLVALLRPHNAAKKIGIPGLQNEGKFGTLKTAPAISIDPHDIFLNIEALNFIPSIRGDIGLAKSLTAESLKEKAKLAHDAFPDLAK
jgi:hypothetical protein